MEKINQKANGLKDNKYKNYNEVFLCGLLWIKQTNASTSVYIIKWALLLNVCNYSFITWPGFPLSMITIRNSD